MFKNTDFQIAFNHLENSKVESEKGVKEVLSNLNSILSSLKKNNYENVEELIKKSIETLQFQDISAQRLTKVQKFLKKIDRLISTHPQKDEIKDFAWEKEVTQENVDEILKSHGL
jgi:hypothetical protein